MGKRSNFERVERDFYPTPLSAVQPLIKFLSQREHPTDFLEPCCGENDLIRHLEANGFMCVHACDISMGEGFDATTLNYRPVWNTAKYDDAYIITNPPWDRKILHPLIENLRHQYPTWLLFDADWMHTKQASFYLSYCKYIVSVGRVKWIPNSKHTGKDNCCWYLFDKDEQETKFYGREKTTSNSRI